MQMCQRESNEYQEKMQFNAYQGINVEEVHIRDCLSQMILHTRYGRGRMLKGVIKRGIIVYLEYF